MASAIDPWYVLRSKPRKEEALFEFASQKGYKVYFPKLNVDPVNPRSRHIVPLFPGYMFVKVDLEDVGVSTFKWMPFSLGLVRFGSTPGSVPEGMVNAIRRRLDEQNSRKAENGSKFQQGDRLRVKDGPFEGFEALFERSTTGQGRVQVLMKLLNGKWAKTELDASSVKKWEETA